MGLLRGEVGGNVPGPEGDLKPFACRYRTQPILCMMVVDRWALPLPELSHCNARPEPDELIVPLESQCQSVQYYINFL